MISKGLEKVKMLQLRPSMHTGSLIFAIVNIVLAVIGTVGSIVCLCAWAATYLVRSPTYDMMMMEETRMTYAILEAGVIFTWMIFSIIYLVFSSFLLNGILKRKPTDIKAYYVFGVGCLTVATLVVVCTFIKHIGYSDTDYTIYEFSSMAIILGLYSLILSMLRSTYTKLEVEIEQFSHVPLNEKC